MKKILFVFLIIASSMSYAQKNEKLKNYFSEMFYSYSELGLYLGVPVGFEKSNFSIGAEAKLYGAYYSPIVSGSAYVNYRKLLLSNKYQIPSHSLAIGGHFMFFGLEIGALFENKDQIWRITPKLGFDWGNISLFYGYDINLNSENKRAFLNHNIQLKYSIYIPNTNF
jgi:hypothetical protein